MPQVQPDSPKEKNMKLTQEQLDAFAQFLQKWIDSLHDQDGDAVVTKFELYQMLKDLQQKFL